jgi:hypothetical protein
MTPITIGQIDVYGSDACELGTFNHKQSERINHAPGD